MTSEVEKLYDARILAHDAEPRNEGPLEEATHRARVSNPLCGDRVELALRLDGRVIAEARFVGRGCAVSRASASMLTERVKGLSTEEARALAGAVEAWLGGGATEPPGLDELASLGGVRSFPSRAKCATLPWEALQQALGAT